MTHEITPAIWRQLRDIAAEWDGRPNADHIFVSRVQGNPSAPATKPGGYWEPEGDHEPA